jgi:hypothetical protein
MIFAETEGTSPDSSLESRPENLQETTARNTLASDAIDDADTTALSVTPVGKPLTVCEDPVDLPALDQRPDYGRSCELVHDLHKFPDIVHESCHQKMVDETRKMSAKRISSDDVLPFQLSCLTQFGDPRLWNIDTVKDALVVCYGYEGIDGASLAWIQSASLSGAALFSANPKILEQAPQPKIIADFLAILRQVPVPDEQIMQKFLEAPEELNPLTFELSRVNSPQLTCQCIQGYFRTAIHPYNVGDVVRHFCETAMDKAKGVPRKDFVRYREVVGSRTPAGVVVRSAFAPSTLRWWLWKNSGVLGLSFHEESFHESEPRLNDFIVWMLSCRLLKQADVLPSGHMGIDIFARCSRSSVAADNALLTFPVLRRRRVLNPPKDNDIAKPRKSSHDESLEAESRHLVAAAAVELAPSHCEEAFASIALEALSSEQSMSTADTLFAHVYQLEYVDLTTMSSEQRLCFFINVYNTLYMHGWIIASQEAEQDYSDFLESYGYRIGGLYFSLSDIKHGILRCNRPAPDALFPPFAPGDPRGNLCSSTAMDDLMTLRVVIALVDIFVFPDRLFEQPHYDPRVLLHDDAGFVNSNLRVASSPHLRSKPVVMEDDFELVEPEEGSSDDEASSPTVATVANSSGPPQSPPSPDLPRIVSNASAAQSSGGAKLFASLFGAAKSRSTLVAHHCVPLVHTKMHEQLQKMEQQFLQRLVDPSQPMLVVGAGPPYPRLIQSLVGLEEFGRTPEDVMKFLNKYRLKASKARTATTATAATCILRRATTKQ